MRRSTSLIRFGESVNDVRMNPLGWLLIGVLATGWLVLGVRPGARRWNALPPSIRSPLEVLYVLLWLLRPWRFSAPGFFASDCAGRRFCLPPSPAYSPRLRFGQRSGVSRISKGAFRRSSLSLSIERSGTGYGLQQPAQPSDSFGRLVVQIPSS